MRLLDVLRAKPVESRSISTLEDYIAAVSGFQYGGIQYPGGIEQTLAGGGSERVGSDFLGLARSAYGANGVVFSCMLARQLAFSAVRFRWQRMRDGKPSDMFATRDLRLLETPWVGGTTQDLLSRVIQDADLAGNAFNATETPLVRLGGDGGQEVVRLRPDWVEIAVTKRVMNNGHVGWRKVGYVYTEGGPQSGGDPVPFLPEDVSHFAPIPDPLATFRGMSWLTPVIREIQGDGLMNRHKSRYFENGATPNMIVKHPDGATPEKIRAFAELLELNHAGAENAYKRLHLYPGADATVVGNNFEQIDFKAVQGAGETRIAAAARVPPVLAGLSEGLQGSSLNQGNWATARRSFADGTMHPLWQNVSGSFGPLLASPGGDVRLWYDASDVPLLREDEKDAAEISETQARTIRTLVDGGYTPESAVAAIEANGDWRLLVHTGYYSVQLRPAGSMGDAPAEPDAAASA